MGVLNQKQCTAFFKNNGVVNVSYLDKSKTIDQYYNLNDCMKPLVTALNKHRPTIRYIKFHHENAKPHVAKSVMTYLESQKFIIMAIYRTLQTLLLLIFGVSISSNNV